MYKFKNKVVRKYLSGATIATMGSALSSVGSAIAASKAQRDYAKNLSKAADAWADSEKSEAEFSVKKEALEEQQKKDEEQLKSFYVDSENGRPSQVVSNFLVNKYVQNALAKFNQAVNEKRDIIKNQAKQIKQDATNQMISGLMNTGIQVAQESGAFDKLGNLAQDKLANSQWGSWMRQTNVQTSNLKVNTNIKPPTTTNIPRIPIQST